MITKTLYVAFKYFKYWREHSMVGDFEVIYSCLCILASIVKRIYLAHLNSISSKWIIGSNCAEMQIRVHFQDFAYSIHFL